MLSRKQKHVLLKFFSMFSVIRGINILIVVLAQYFTSIYILAPDVPLGEIIFDVKLLNIVLATAAAIAGGYIINNFYDSEKDLINRPQKSMLDRLVSQKTKLYFFIFLVLIVVSSTIQVSIRAFIFFLIYVFGIWLYSHKLKKLSIIGNITSAILTITPIFAVFLYYKNFQTVIVFHAVFLFLIITMRELTKDLENIKGDLALGYKTIPVVYGEKVSKKMLTALSFFTLLPTSVLIANYDIGSMNYFFYLSIILLIVFFLLLQKAVTKLQYLILHNILKFILVAGVLSILLIDINLLLNRIL